MVVIEKYMEESSVKQMMLKTDEISIGLHVDEEEAEGQSLKLALWQPWV